MAKKECPYCGTRRHWHPDINLCLDDDCPSDGIWKTSYEQLCRKYEKVIKQLRDKPSLNKS